MSMFGMFRSFLVDIELGRKEFLWSLVLAIISCSSFNVSVFK